MRRVRHVAVLVESSRGYGRGLIEGIAQYSREHGTWSIYFEPHDLDSSPPKWLRTWSGDGILVRLDDVRMLEAVLAAGVPAVDVRGRLHDSPLPLVGGDNREMTRLVFQHLREQGLRQFAFCGLPAGSGDNRFLDLRRSTFLGLAQQVGCCCHVFEISGDEQHSAPDWEQEIDRMAQWLRDLPKPIGVMACDDHRGFQLLDACRREEIVVPDEVAVVGVNNDTVLCHLAHPPLSSIDPGAVRIGYEAAACLDEMMQGRATPREPVFLEPWRLVVRQSSDVIAVEDRDVAAALRYIRTHACLGIRVEDLLREFATSRSSLERRFRRHVGRTPKSEILRVQMNQAQLLLADSELPISEIARRTGFGNEKYFSDAFVRELGLRPGAYRSRKQAGMGGQRI